MLFHRYSEERREWREALEIESDLTYMLIFLKTMGKTKLYILPRAYCVNDKTVKCKKGITVKARQWFVGREMVLFGMGHMEARLGAWQSSIS